MRSFPKVGKIDNDSGACWKFVKASLEDGGRDDEQGDGEGVSQLTLEAIRQSERCAVCWSRAQQPSWGMAGWVDRFHGLNCYPQIPTLKS